MKKFLFALCAFALALPSVAADNNNIKMVTYFPVPYASYGDLGVTGTCDVGLMGQCKLDAGEGLKVAKASSDSRALNTGSIIVRKGTLGLTPQTSVALGTQLTAGSGTGTGVLEFSHDLAVTSINSSRLAKAQAMNEAQMTSLNMYGHAFPTCDADDHEISWKSLTLGKKSGVFLVCGGGKEVQGCSNPSYAAQNPCECDSSYASANPCECDWGYANDNPCACGVVTSCAWYQDSAPPESLNDFNVSKSHANSQGATYVIGQSCNKYSASAYCKQNVKITVANRTGTCPSNRPLLSVYDLPEYCNSNAHGHGAPFTIAINMGAYGSCKTLTCPGVYAEYSYSPNDDLSWDGVTYIGCSCPR